MACIFCVNCESYYGFRRLLSHQQSIILSSYSHLHVWEFNYYNYYTIVVESWLVYTVVQT